MTHMDDLLLRAARRERTPRTPVWLMRQAGRTDPEYRALRRRVDLPLEELFRHPDLATEVSLLPRRWGVDAIIVFQDILTPLVPAGAPFVFRPGPRLDRPFDPVRSLDRLKLYDPAEELGFVGSILGNLRRELRDELPLIGFAGAPLTLAFFLLEGKSPGPDATATHKLMREYPVILHRLLERLTAITIDYLTYQISCGAQIVQLFESLADRLNRQEYVSFAHPYHERVFEAIRGRVPTVLFAKEQTCVDLMAASGADVISVGKCVDIGAVRRTVGDRVAVQGNVDNELLVTGSFEEIDAAVRDCIVAGGQQGHILNLNHGLLQETPFENVCRIVEAAKAVVRAGESEIAEGVCAKRGGNHHE